MLRSDYAKRLEGKRIENQKTLPVRPTVLYVCKRLMYVYMYVKVRPLTATLLCRCCVNSYQTERHSERACDVIFKNLFLGNKGPQRKSRNTCPIFFDVVSPKNLSTKNRSDTCRSLLVCATTWFIWFYLFSNFIFKQEHKFSVPTWFHFLLFWKKILRVDIYHGSYVDQWHRKVSCRNGEPAESEGSWGCLTTAAMVAMTMKPVAYEPLSRSFHRQGTDFDCGVIHEFFIHLFLTTYTKAVL